MSIEVTGLLAGHAGANSATIWLELDSTQRLVEVEWPDRLTVQPKPLAIVDDSGNQLARPGDRVKLTGTWRDQIGGTPRFELSDMGLRLEAARGGYQTFSGRVRHPLTSLVLSTLYLLVGVASLLTAIADNRSPVLPAIELGVGILWTATSLRALLRSRQVG